MAGPISKSISTGIQYFTYVSVNTDFEERLVDELGKINIIMKPVTESPNYARYPRMILKYIENADEYLKEMETLNDVIAKLHARDVLVLILRQFKSPLNETKTSKSQNKQELINKQEPKIEEKVKKKRELKNKQELKNKPELTNEQELQNKPELTNEQELQNKPELTNEQELQNKPNLTNEQELQNKPELTNEQELQNKPELTNEQELQNKPELTNEQELQNKPELTNEQELQNKPNLTNEQELQNKPELTDEQELQNKPELTNEQERQNKPELIKEQKLQNKPELTKEQELQNKKELHLFKNIVAQKAKSFAIAYDRAPPDKLLITATEFVEKELNIKLVPAQDVQESPLVVICKNDSQLQEDIDNAKKRTRAGEDVMLLVVTASDKLRLVDTKATEGFGSKAKLKWDFHRERFSRKENQECIERLQTFFQRYGCDEWLRLERRDSMKLFSRNFGHRKSMDFYPTLPDVSVKIENGMENINTRQQNTTLKGKQSKHLPLVLFKTDKELTEEYVPYFCDRIRLSMKRNDPQLVVHFCCNSDKPLKMSNENLERIKAAMAKANESSSSKTN